VPADSPLRAPRIREHRRGPRWILFTDGAVHREMGGAALRWRAVENALGRLGPGHRVRIRCVCGDSHSVAPSVDVSQADPYRHKFCPAVLSGVEERIRRDQPDVVVFSGLELTNYLIRVRTPPGTRIVIDLHNAEAELCREMTVMRASGLTLSMARCEALHEVERSCFAHAADIWVCSERDRRIIHRDHPAIRQRVHVVPNGLAEESLRSAVRGDGRITRVLFPGRLDWAPNADAAAFLIRSVFGPLARTFPRVEFVVAGARPKALLRYHAPPVLVVADPVDMEPLWAGAVLAVPLRTGGGSRIKIIEAFARGVPVVASAKAVEGLLVEPGVHYFPAENASDFVLGLAAIVSGEQDLADVRTRASAYVERNHSIGAVTAAVARSPAVGADDRSGSREEESRCIE
jgi:glycosyltransferase involved in cell wall biosynthesis